jgi:DNA-binding NtrC family response regulator
MSGSGIGGPFRVLIVDDDSLVRWALGRMLNDHGCTVVEGENAHAATLAITDNGHVFDVILLDYHLPDSHDLHLLMTLRRLAPASKIVMMSSHMMRDEIDAAHALGASAFMPKPFDLDDTWNLLVRTHAA